MPRIRKYLLKVNIYYPMNNRGNNACDLLLESNLSSSLKIKSNNRKWICWIFHILCHRNHGIHGIYYHRDLVQKYYFSLRMRYFKSQSRYVFINHNEKVIYLNFPYTEFMSQLLLLGILFKDLMSEWLWKSNTCFMQEMKQQTHSGFIEVVGWECLFFVAAAIHGPSFPITMAI